MGQKLKYGSKYWLEKFRKHFEIHKIEAETVTTVYEATRSYPKKSKNYRRARK